MPLRLFAQPPLPELRTEPAAGGSIFYIRNVGAQPLTAYLIELVAVPDYVNSDGSSSSIPENIAQFIERRRSVLETTRALIRRLEKGQSARDLKQWADSIIAETAAHFDDALLPRLRASERALAASKPAL